MYVLIATYKKPLAEIEAHLDDHRAYLEIFYEKDKLLASGPQVPRTGGIILGLFTNDEEARSFVSKDPFTQAGVAEYQIIRFTPVATSPRLQLT